MPKSFAQWEAERRAGQGEIPPVQEEDTSSILPSGAAAAGSLLGLLAPELTLPGAALGSSVKELARDVPKLLQNGIGPMSGEGVGGAMLDSAENIGSDVLKTALFNKLPGLVGGTMRQGGKILTKAGQMGSDIPITYRAALGPVMTMLGMPGWADLGAEAAAVAGPKVASTVGPVMTKVGNATPGSIMDMARSTLGALKPGLPAEPTPDPGPVRWDQRFESEWRPRARRWDGPRTAETGDQIGGIPRPSSKATPLTEGPVSMDDAELAQEMIDKARNTGSGYVTQNTPAYMKDAESTAVRTVAGKKPAVQDSLRSLMDAIKRQR